MPSNPLKVSRSTLLRTLTDDPALPALIARMDAPSLRKLVEHVGLHDAGALIAHTSPEQLAALLDDAIWSRAAGSADETLSIEELLRWLDVWHDIGDEFTATRLIDLGDDFCATAFAQLVRVTESGPVEDFMAVFGEYRVTARYEDEWDTVHAALNALWAESPDFLLHLLGRLAFRHSILGVNDAARRLHADAAGERRSRRQAAGFVADADAAAVLASFRERPLDALASMQAYEPLTALQLRTPVSPPPIREQEEDEGDDDRDVEISDEDIDRLQAALEEAELMPTRQHERLTGPAARTREVALERALGTLEADALSGRMRELAYLANTLIAGTLHEGERFTEEKAARAAMATSNLGFLYLRARDTDSDAALTDAEPGLVRAFAVGYALIGRLPEIVATRLAALFSSPEIRERIGTKPWVLSEVDALVTSGALRHAVLTRRFDDAKETVALLQIALDPHACTTLRALVDDYPAFPLAIEQPAGGEKVTAATRFIDSPDDLATIEKVLQSLEQSVRL